MLNVAANVLMFKMTKSAEVHKWGQRHDFKFIKISLFANIKIQCDKVNMK